MSRDPDALAAANSCATLRIGGAATRWLITVAIAGSLWPATVDADSDGTRLQAHDHRICAHLGRVLERRGLTEREAARLTRRGCARDDHGWYSARIYPAGG